VTERKRERENEEKKRGRDNARAPGYLDGYVRFTGRRWLRPVCPSFAFPQKRGPLQRLRHALHGHCAAGRLTLSRLGPLGSGFASADRPVPLWPRSHKHWSAGTRPVSLLELVFGGDRCRKTQTRISADQNKTRCASRSQPTTRQFLRLQPEPRKQFLRGWLEWVPHFTLTSQNTNNTTSNHINTHNHRVHLASASMRKKRQDTENTCEATSGSF
jgi:hypothetical protein